MAYSCVMLNYCVSYLFFFAFRALGSLSLKICIRPRQRSVIYCITYLISYLRDSVFLNLKCYLVQIFSWYLVLKERQIAVIGRWKITQDFKRCFQSVQCSTLTKFLVMWKFLLHKRHMITKLYAVVIINWKVLCRGPETPFILLALRQFASFLCVASSPVCQCLNVTSNEC